MTRSGADHETFREPAPPPAPEAGRRIRSAHSRTLPGMISMVRSEVEPDSNSDFEFLVRLERFHRQFEVILSIESKDHTLTDVLFRLSLDDPQVGPSFEAFHAFAAGEARMRDIEAGQQWFMFFDEPHAADHPPTPIGELKCEAAPLVARVVGRAQALNDQYGEAGLFAWTAGSIAAVAFMALAIGPAWIGFLAGFLPASALAAWAVADA